MAALIKTIEAWLDELNLPVSICREELYRRVIQRGLERMNSTLEFRSTFQGERDDPSLTGSITNMHADNWTIGDLCAANVKGIIDNLMNRIPDTFLSKLQIEQYVCTGSAVELNPLFQKYIAQKMQTLHVTAESKTAAAAAALLFQQTKRLC